MNTPFTDSMALHILELEQSSPRFERFCCDLFSIVDARHYVPTSWNYDQGRDGRTIDHPRGEPEGVICATFRKDVTVKAEEDASSLASRSWKPSVVRYCYARPLTERQVDKVKAIFGKHLGPEVTTHVDGAEQISALAVRCPPAFERHYAGELRNMRSALAVDTGDADEIQLTGMRIALTTQLSDSALALRDDVQKNLILTVLASCKSCTLDDLSRRVSDMLHLPRAVASDSLRAAVTALHEDALLQEADGRYSITSHGRDHLRDRTAAGTSKLAAGQDSIRRALSILTGYDLEDQAFARIWNVLQDNVAAMFLQNGIYITQATASIQTGQTVLKEQPDLRKAIGDFGATVSALPFLAPRGAEIGQAVIDLFDEAESDAFAWLADISVVYVALCSLGLDPRSQSQLQQRLREMDLLLDTDIVLSLLSPGEPQHTAVKAIIGGWRRIGGSVYVAPSVLEEASYHAWISERDYEETWRSLGTMTAQDALHLIQNAFVRGFRVEAKGKFHRAVWGRYIGMFRGRDEYDYSRIAEILSDDGVLMLAEDGVDNRLASRVSAAVLSLDVGDRDHPQDVGREFRDKCERDGRLMAVLLKHRKAREETNGSAVIVSSSRRLRTAASGFRSIFAHPEPVIPAGAVAYFLAMIPGVNLSLGTLKGVLFDTGFASKLHGLERIALRVLHACKEYSLPFARRGALRYEMRTRIRALAGQLGRQPEDIELDIIRGRAEAKADIATVVAGAVDKLVSSASEKRVQELESRIRELEHRP